MTIKDNLESIKKDISDDITILAATKKRTVKEIQEAIDSGIRIIGENYVQEAQSKYKELKDKTEIHCIGHLQTNKVKKAVKIFDMIQTVDSLKLAKEINKRTKKIMPVLIEVNIGEEENKDGCMPSEVKSLAEDITKLPNLQLKGLMTMAPKGKEEPYFIKIKDIYDRLKEKYNFSILSMGMSDSYREAVKHGCTMIRLGTALFGPRN